MMAQSRRRLFGANELLDALSDLFDRYVFVDVESNDRLVVHRVGSVIASRKSKYQQIDIFRTPQFGLMLTLDGIVQLGQSDEHIYHEVLIHPACLMLPRVRSALVLGGGDGCACRELLKYHELDAVDMVEIDAAVIEMCRAHLHEINCGSLDNPLVNIVLTDAERYLRDQPEKHYDLIVADLTDPYDSSGNRADLSRHLFSQSFYRLLKDHLSPGGILVSQTGGVTFNPRVDLYHAAIVQDLTRCFHEVATAYVYVHSFDQLWSVALASDHTYAFARFNPDPALKRKQVSDLKYYDAISHSAAFCPPRHLRDCNARQSAT